MARSSNYAWTHVKHDANPQALQPPLQGEVPPQAASSLAKFSSLAIESPFKKNE